VPYSEKARTNLGFSRLAQLRFFRLRTIRPKPKLTEASLAWLVGRPAGKLWIGLEQVGRYGAYPGRLVVNYLDGAG
jgi:hypothetical protein